MTTKYFEQTSANVPITLVCQREDVIRFFHALAVDDALTNPSKENIENRNNLKDILDQS